MDLKGHAKGYLQQPKTKEKRIEKNEMEKKTGLAPLKLLSNVYWMGGCMVLKAKAMLRIA